MVSPAAPPVLEEELDEEELEDEDDDDELVELPLLLLEESQPNKNAIQIRMKTGLEVRVTMCIVSCIVSSMEWLLLNFSVKQYAGRERDT
jgi:hypothetical protein